MDLNTSEWKYFTLPELFLIDGGNKFDKSKMQQSFYSNINFVGRTASNNGVTAIVDKIEDVEPYPAGQITLALGGSIGSCFIQDAPFYTSQNVAVLCPLVDMSLYTKQFIATLIRNESINNYITFARELNAHIKTDFRIKLPVTNRGTPDYQFMENYIKSLNGDVSDIPDYFLDGGYNEACWYMDNIDTTVFEAQYASKANSHNIKLTDREWQNFTVSDIFNIINGKGITKEEIFDNAGMTPAIQGGASNKGILGFIDSDFCLSQEYVIIDQPCLTIARVGSTASVNYQNYGCVVGDKAKALLPKQHLTEACFLFLETILMQLKDKYGYGVRGVVKEIYENEIIKLPVDENGKPDYQFMEDYMKSRPFSCQLVNKPIDNDDKYG